MAPDTSRNSLQPQDAEWGAAWALLPVVATGGYYLLPDFLKEYRLVQFAPQLLAYFALCLWASRNSDVLFRLGLAGTNIPDGLRWGSLTGVLLGSFNTFVILTVYPSLGYDINFLKDTPHGQLPLLAMVPWFIVMIALFVELNYRGFILGRLASMESRAWRSDQHRRLPPLALMAGSLIFVFDPFMVQTFRHLHWIALWDGLIWGIIRLRTGNLCITIVAHAIEVMVMYLVVRAAIG